MIGTGEQKTNQVAIVIDNASFGYKKNVPVLDQFNMQVQTGIMIHYLFLFLTIQI